MPNPSEVSQIVENSAPAAGGLLAYLGIKQLILDPYQKYSPVALGFTILVTYLLAAGLPFMAVLLNTMDWFDVLLTRIGSVVTIFGGVVATMSVIKKTWPDKKRKK